jgi:hypothetical protein
MGAYCSELLNLNEFSGRERMQKKIDKDVRHNQEREGNNDYQEMANIGEKV